MSAFHAGGGVMDFSLKYMENVPSVRGVSDSHINMTRAPKQYSTHPNTHPVPLFSVLQNVLHKES